MKKLTISPSRISGTIHAPPSKSETHREFILAGLAAGTSVINHPLLSGDTLATLHGIQALGAQVYRSYDAVSITGGNLHAADGIIDCRNSGTTLRLLVAVAATLNGTTRFTGDVSLMARPMDPLFNALRFCGATISRKENVIAITGPITPQFVDIPGNISSQFVSALLIIGCSVHLTTPLVSAPYVAMTVSALERRGCFITVSDTTYSIKSRRILPSSCTIEGDWSSAAYLLVAGALAGSVTIIGLSSCSQQGDKEILEILRKMGAEVKQNDETVSVMTRSLHAITCNMETIPDLFPIVAVLAAYAAGTSRLYGVAHLIYKESNRLQSIVDMLVALGTSCELHQDGCSVMGGRLQGSRISTAGDHRVFMAAVIAGLVATGSTEIVDADDEAHISYPTFVRDIRELGGRLQ